MERNDFALGMLLGGLGGLAAGYLLSRNSRVDDQPAAATIDLTPAMEKAAADRSPGMAVPATAPRGEANKE